MVGNAEMFPFDDAIMLVVKSSPEPLFTKRSDVLPLNIVKFRSREVECYNDYNALKFDWHLGSSADDVPVKFQSDQKSQHPNPAASRLRGTRSYGKPSVGLVTE